MNAQRLLTGAALAVTLMLGFWLARNALPPPIKFQPLQQGTDYSAQGITLTQMRADGKPRYRLRASALAHTLPDRLTRLTDPVLVVYPEHGPPVTLRSPSAILMPGDTIVHMPQQVVITRPDAQGHEIRVTTEDVTVDTRRQTATSSRPTRIQAPHAVTDGTGLNANFKQQTFDLLKDVHSVYTPIRPTR
ncbi:LPS export ABC transporter periplasmic protein LptC [Acidihalobacter aeolianus]|uniref:LPS export ABC transporter periplasmic protein LptC n=1 Tax=Acidihalobacter aeolianus TaxID=2792603 RepID=A0A1D8KAI6_9GAMM|nr:LPS export ABC transporter periplasmic protein LptC [Acidihalobacter aeolianus]AOV17947.1 LPS export ABC transporter periplasmic protein LptC [Acidihalobacter aeolianus]